MYNVFIQDKIYLLQHIKKLLDKTTCEHYPQPNGIVKPSQDNINKELS